MPIDPIQTIGAAGPARAAESVSRVAAGPLGARFDAALAQVSDAQNTADVHLARLAAGEKVDIHTTMISLQEADIHLRTLVSVRDRAVEAYQQIMNMPI